MTDCLTQPRAAAWVLGLAVGWLAAAGADAAYLVLQGGARVEGRDVRRDARGDYVIETEAGSRTYRAAQVVFAEADKPAGYDQAIAEYNAGRADQAVTALTEIARRNRGLGWDDRAQAAIARIRGSQARFPEVVQAGEAISPAFLAAQPDVQFLYWRALLETGAYTKLTGLLDPVIRAGDRSPAARALVLRGDANRRQRLLEAAALDYLRTVTLFKAVKDVQPEALFKAGETLEEMRHAKAKEMFERLIQEYPESEYAQRARAR